jgi:hypothetical protein
LGVLETFLVPPKGLKYRQRLCRNTGELEEILQRLQKIHRGSGKFIEVPKFPESSYFFQRLSTTVSKVLKRRFWKK